MNYTDFYLFTDFDGTLVNYDLTIPQNNLKAIEEFTANGGHFAISTGRPYKWLGEFLKGVTINFPCIVSNGCGIYDYSAQKFLYENFLGPEVKEYLAEIEAENPDVGILVCSNGEQFDIQHELDMINNVFADKLPGTPAVEWRDNIEKWYKVLFVMQKELTEDFFMRMKAKKYPNIRLIKSSDYLVEMLPAESSKGSALEKLIEITGVKREKTVAIGDYYNDIEIICAAGTGACVSGAPTELKDLCKYVTCPCGDGAIADLIEKLKAEYPLRDC